MERYSLPVELYRPIARCIRSKRALCAFARVSRATQPEAERLIYRWLTAKTAIEIVVLLKRIVSLKRIGPYVFSLDIKHSHRFSLHERPMIPTSALFQLLSSALTLLAGLRHLVIDFSDVYQGSSISCSFIFNRAPFRLFSFASSLSVDAGFVRFLLHQPDIVYISFLSFPWYPSTIPPHALPKLRAVHSVIDHFTWSFLPDRLLTHLSMHHLRASTPAGSLSSLRVLKIRSIPEIAPDLEIIYGLDDDIVDIGEQAATLSNLKKLKEVEISGKILRVHEKERIVANLHKLCPSLRIVHCVVTGGSRDPGGCFFSWDGKSWIKGYHLGTISMWDVGISEIMPYND